MRNDKNKRNTFSEASKTNLSNISRSLYNGYSQEIFSKIYLKDQMNIIKNTKNFAKYVSNTDTANPLIKITKIKPTYANNCTNSKEIKLLRMKLHQNNLKSIVNKSMDGKKKIEIKITNQGFFSLNSGTISPFAKSSTASMLSYTENNAPKNTFQFSNEKLTKLNVR